MKLLALALLAAVGFAGVFSTRDASSKTLAEHGAAALRGVDDPPPVDCPFCGGNAQQHIRTMRRILVAQSRVSLSVAMAR